MADIAQLLSRVTAIEARVAALQTAGLHPVRLGDIANLTTEVKYPPVTAPEGLDGLHIVFSQSGNQKYLRMLSLSGSSVASATKTAYVCTGSDKRFQQYLYTYFYDGPGTTPDTPGGPDVVYKTVTYPTKAMTRNDMTGDKTFPALVHQSGVFPKTGAYAYLAFNDSTTTAWLSAAQATQANPQWLWIRMPRALRRIQVTIWSRTGRRVTNPATGFISLSNDGETWAVPEAGYFNWSNTGEGVALGTVSCGNSDPYTYVRVSVTSCVGNYAKYYASIGKITITGEYADDGLVSKDIDDTEEVE